MAEMDRRPCALVMAAAPMPTGKAGEPSAREPLDEGGFRPQPPLPTNRRRLTVDSASMATNPFHANATLTRQTSFARIVLEEGILKVHLTGPHLGEREATVLSRELNDALEAVGRHFRILLLDLSDVQMMTSVGLGLCIDARNHAQREGAPTVLYGLSSQLRDLFRMMKVDRLYRMVHSEAELSRALAA